MDFAQLFEKRKEQNRGFKMMMVVRRALAVQARAKIKPNSMRPSLREMSKLRGGDAPDTGTPLDLYWPEK